MIVLWLLVAHLVGDYLLQTRWQAAGKFGWTAEAVELRMRHVFGYCAAFVPVAFVYGISNWRPSHGFYPNVVAFLALLYIVHFFTDAQRFKSTPGEWFIWPSLSAIARREEQDRAWATGTPVGVTSSTLPPNPWPTIGLAIDQTLHLIQIAVLAQLFLT